jgi:DNA-binding MarR family transcriptional regulator
MMEYGDATVATATAELPYRSRPLAALLDVFALWGSGEFIAALGHESGHSLDATSIVAITVLAREGALRPSVLAERLRVGASNVSKISGRLSSLGLVERTPDPDDARAGLLRLTAAGTDVMTRLIDAGDEMMSAILEDWPEADRDAFDRLLRRFQADATAYARRYRG